MQLELGRLIAAIGQNVTEAQKSVEANGIANYLSYFSTADAAEQAAGCKRAETTRVALPSLSGQAESYVDVPLVTLAHHKAVELDRVTVKLRAAVSTGDNERVFVDVGSPEGVDQAGVMTELELCFRCDAAPEGIARVNTELNKFL